MKIAGHTAKITSVFESTPQYFRPYLTDDPAEFSVTVTKEMIDFEQADLLEEALCNASQLTSLRIGDFVAVELKELQKLASREEGNIAVKGEFCEKDVFSFNIVF